MSTLHSPSAPQMTHFSVRPSTVAVCVPSLALYVLLVTLGTVRPACAQGTAGDSTQAHALSLDEAVRTAQERSPVLRIARNAVTRAQGQTYQARSGLLPQLNGSANYTRTIQSQFAAASGSNSPSDTTHQVLGPPAPCNQYILGPSASASQRLAGLEQYAQCTSSTSSGFGGIDFSKVGFGAPNAYTLSLNASQNLFTGGRIMGQIQAAQAGRHSAEIEVTAQRAQLILDVTQAYYAAALSDRLLEIALEHHYNRRKISCSRHNSSTTSGGRRSTTFSVLP